MVAYRDTLNSFPVEGSSKGRTLCLITGMFLASFSCDRPGTRVTYIFFHVGVFEGSQLGAQKRI